MFASVFLGYFVNIKMNKKPPHSTQIERSGVLFQKRWDRMRNREGRCTKDKPLP